MTKKKCKLCKTSFTGRRDKIFCSLACKNEYHLRLRQATNLATKSIDEILHRNRSILLEVMGKHGTKVKVDSFVLDNKKFNYKFYTGSSTNKEGKTYYHVYDFSYMTFSDQTVMIVRKK